MYIFFIVGFLHARTLSYAYVLDLNQTFVQHFELLTTPKICGKANSNEAMKKLVCLGYVHIRP